MSLLDSSLDFFIEALRYAAPDQDIDARKLKFAVLHASSSLELLLKFKLFQQHWALIFANVDKADKKSLETGDFTSVDFRMAMERIESICGIKLSDSDKRILNDLRKLRNILQHYYQDINKEQAYSLIVKAWLFAYEFLTEYFLEEDLSPASEAIDKIRSEVSQHQAFVDGRLLTIHDELESLEQDGGLVLDCHICEQETAAINGGTTECLFCRKVFQWEEFADQWLRNHAGYRWLDPKERYSDPVLTECPECNMESLYHDTSGEGSMTPSIRSWICFFCGTSYGEGAIDNCMKCNRTFAKDDENSPFCESCWRT